MVADAFRIAFEQQLRKRSEHFLLLAEANLLKTQNYKQEGKSAISLAIHELVKENLLYKSLLLLKSSFHHCYVPHQDLLCTKFGEDWIKTVEVVKDN